MLTMIEAFDVKTTGAGQLLLGGPPAPHHNLRTLVPSADQTMRLSANGRCCVKVNLPSSKTLLLAVVRWL
jgi:hypothetical protein